LDYIIREKARDDLEWIWLYTLNEWGLAQADIYIGQLIDRFEWLAQHPYAGRNRTDIDPIYYCFPEGKHHIFYIINSNIEIIGIPHQQMDIIDYFEKP
jgi:toxin ParE1/3/4